MFGHPSAVGGQGLEFFKRAFGRLLRRHVGVETGQEKLAVPFAPLL